MQTNPENNLQPKPEDSNISWEKDIYNSSLIQRNLLWILNFLLGITVIGCLIWMQFKSSENRIEPFVIEIDKKSGIATTVKPLSIQEYSANTAVLRSLIIQYIRAREEYNYYLFEKNFSYLVRVFSNPVIYYSYKSVASTSNPSSPYNILGKNGNITVKWKSIIFPAQNTAQIRISVETTSSIGNVVQKDKIILMSFTFDQTSEMTEEDRLLNPLGFIVTMYKIEDENPNI
jgi:type IV secretion system protein VirB8